MTIEAPARQQDTEQPCARFSVEVGSRTTDAVFTQGSHVSTQEEDVVSIYQDPILEIWSLYY